MLIQNHQFQLFLVKFQDFSHFCSVTSFVKFSPPIHVYKFYYNYIIVIIISFMMLTLYKITPKPSAGRRKIWHELQSVKYGRYWSSNQRSRISRSEEDLWTSRSERCELISPVAASEAEFATRVLQLFKVISHISDLIKPMMNILICLCIFKTTFPV